MHKKVYIERSLKLTVLVFSLFFFLFDLYVFFGGFLESEWIISFCKQALRVYFLSFLFYIYLNKAHYGKKILLDLGKMLFFSLYISFMLSNGFWVILAAIAFILG